MSRNWTHYQGAGRFSGVRIYLRTDSQEKQQPEHSILKFSSSWLFKQGSPEPYSHQVFQIKSIFINLLHIFNLAKKPLLLAPDDLDATSKVR